MKTLRIAILPLFGMPNYTHDSNFRVYMDIIKTANRLKLPIHFYYCLPEITDSLEKLPNVTYVPVDMELRDFYGEMGRVPKEMHSLFSRKGGKYIIDAVFTSRTMAIDALSSTLADNRRDEIMPVHLFDPLVRVDSTTNKDIRKAMAFGYSKSHNWFLNENEMNKALLECRNWLSPTLYLEAKERSYVRGLPLAIKEIDEIVSKTPKHSKFRAFWGARMSAEKNPQLTAEFMEKLNSSGRDVDLVMTTQAMSPKLVKAVKENLKGSVTEIQTGCARPVFLELVASSHMFLCSSRVEGFPVGFMEQLYAIGIGIFPNNDWVKKLLPKDYPFIYKNNTEAHTMIRYIFENYDKAYEEAKWIKDWLRENFNEERIVNSFYETLENSIQDNNDFISNLGSFKKITQQALDSLGDEFSYEELIKFIEDTAETWKAKKIKYLGAPSVYEIHKYVLEAGYIDTCDNKQPYYKKIK